MNNSAKSSHPVMPAFQQHLRTTQFAACDAGRKRIDDEGPLDGVNQILCTDCHNSGYNREFGVGSERFWTAPKRPHILEHNYVSDSPLRDQGLAITVRKQDA